MIARGATTVRKLGGALMTRVSHHTFGLEHMSSFRSFRGNIASPIIETLLTGLFPRRGLVDRLRAASPCFHGALRWSLAARRGTTGDQTQGAAKRQTRVGSDTHTK